MMSHISAPILPTGVTAFAGETIEIKDSTAPFFWFLLLELEQVIIQPPISSKDKKSPSSELTGVGEVFSAITPS